MSPLVRIASACCLSLVSILRCHSEPSLWPVIPSEARNLALVRGGRAQSEIPRFARNDNLHNGFQSGVTIVVALGRPQGHPYACPARATSEVTRGSNLFPHPTQDVAEGWFISLHRGQTLGEWVVGTLTKPEGNPAMLLSPAGRVTRARKPKMFKKKPARNHGHALSE